MENKKFNIIKNNEFLEVIFYSQAFWQYFHNLYLDLSKNCPADKIFFEHTWIIIYIKNHDQSTISDLVKISKKNQSTLSRAVKTLEKGGFITKTRNKKSFILNLTKEGINLYFHLEKIYSYLNNLFLKKIEKEKILSLLNYFKEINTNLEINNIEYNKELL